MLVYIKQTVKILFYKTLFGLLYAKFDRLLDSQERSNSYYEKVIAEWHIKKDL